MNYTPDLNRGLIKTHLRFKGLNLAAKSALLSSQCLLHTGVLSSLSGADGPANTSHAGGKHIAAPRGEDCLKTNAN